VDDQPDVSCKDSTSQYAVDDPLLSTDLAVGGSNPSRRPETAGQRRYSRASADCGALTWRSFECGTSSRPAKGLDVGRGQAASVAFTSGHHATPAAAEQHRCMRTGVYR
jgi:hypothetical protein